MTPSDPSTQPPPWIFIVTDLAFICAAIAIGASQPRPFSSGAMIAIVGCLLAGAIVLFYPIVTHYERVKNEALDDRQRALEALARTLTSSAEQISIAANGLHEVAELAQKNIRQAEHLPQKLHERIAEFEARLAAANDAEKDELEKELVALRTSESERLDSVSDRIAKSTAEWTKLEAATQKNLAASRETIERAATDAVAQLTTSLPAALATATAAAAASASEAIAAAAVSAERTLAELQSAAAAKQEAALAAALARASTDVDATLAAGQTRAAVELDAKIAALTQALATATSDALAKIDTALASSATRLETAVNEAVKAIPVAAPAPTAPVELAPLPVIVPEPESAALVEPVAKSENTPTADSPAATAEAPAHPPKRPRKPRRTEPTPEDEPAVAVEAVAPPTEPTPLPAPEPVIEPAAVVTPEEPAPIPVASIVEVEPVAPHTAEPFAIDPEPQVSPIAPEEFATTTPISDEVVAAPLFASPPEPAPEAPPVPTEEAEAEPEPTPEPEVDSEPAAETPPEPISPPVVTEDEEPAPRKRTKAPAPAEPADDEPHLGLEIDDTPPPQAAEVAEHVLTSDGATRLIVTAYIGIGNRLFIRGEGPGLSWEKGVPLQFVSIGKWRWETPDATGPVSFKLYKNDTVDCTALGTRLIEPAHQQEVMASF